MAKTLKRDVYLDGFLHSAGTELDDAKAERITNPLAFEDRALPDQDGRKATEQARTRDGYATGEPATAPDTGRNAVKTTAKPAR